MSKLKLNFDVYAKYSNHPFITDIISNLKLLQDNKIKEYNQATRKQTYQAIVKDMNFAFTNIKNSIKKEN
jgi:hypothetical protein